jgi:hypothetical protein
MDYGTTQAATRRSARRPRLATLTACAALLCIPAAASADGPTVTTLPGDPTLITDTYALLSGIVNPNGVATSYHFEWGPTTAYGQSTPETQAGNGKADVNVDISLDELKPATTYHYRLVASVVQADPSAPPATVAGVDEVVKTAPSLAIGFIGKQAHVSKLGKALVQVRCVGPVDDVCSGRLTLTAALDGKTARTVGSVAYKLAVGSKKTLRVKLSAAARTALATATGQKLGATASAKTSGIKQPLVKQLALAG